MVRSGVRRIARWAQEAGLFLRDSRTPLAFARVMRARLSLSRVGWLVAPKAFETEFSSRALGPRVRLRSHSSDISVLGELLVGSYSQLPAEDKVRTVVDLGANTGLALRWMHHRYPAARFVCVEPELGNVEVLRQNAANAGGEILVVPACVGGHERRVSLTTDSGEFAFRMLEDASGAFRVMTMDQVLDLAGFRGPVDILKCDIEGAELEVFADCASWITRVRWIVVECHYPYTSQALTHSIACNGGEFEQRHIERNPAFGAETVTLCSTAERLAPSGVTLAPVAAAQRGRSF